MQAASRESYATAVERLEALARSVEPDALDRAADELLAVAQLLRREPRLRRALSDPARSGEERAGLLRSLVEGKVGAQAQELLDVLAGGRWSAPLELLEATERLAVDTLLAGADRADALAEVEDELFRFGQIVDGDPQLAVTIADSTVPPERRVELVRSLLDGKVKSATLRLAEVAVGGFGGRSFAAALSRLVELAAERRERQVAYVTVAAPLSEDEERRLGATLSRLYGRDVTVKMTVDPEILGGISVQVGADLYDGTVLRRLHETRNALAKR